MNGEELKAAADAELLLAWRAGDSLAGNVLFDRYHTNLWRFFNSKRLPHVAELVQQTFHNCLTGCQRLRDYSRFKSFLFGIAHHVLYEDCRRRRRDQRPPNFDCDTAYELGEGPEHFVLLKQERRILLKALRRIPLNLQIILELRHWEELSMADIAEVLSKPPGTISSWFAAARETLKSQILAVSESREAANSTLDDLDHWVAEIRGLVRSQDALEARGQHSAGPARQGPSSASGRARAVG